MIKRTLLGCLMMASYMLSMAASANVFTGSNSHINKIIQDHLGYIWIATDNGLTRFDGHNVKTFTRNSEASSLLNNTVLSVFEDSRNDIWVGTYNGIQKFNRATETFETPRLSYPGVPEFTYVNSIIEDSKGNIWFTTSRSGLICFKADDQKPVWYITTNSAISSDRTTVVFEDKFGNIWVGTNDNGITMFNPSNNTMSHYAHNPDDESSLSGNMIYSMVQANDGQLYVASLDGGIDSYNYRTHKFKRNAIPVEGKAFVLKNDEDSDIIYIGTDGNGLFSYDIKSRELSPLEPDVRDFDIRHAKVHDIIKDRQGNIWAAIYQQGALMIPTTVEGTQTFGHNPYNPARNIGSTPVLSILKDISGRLWIGTDGDGIYYSDENGDFTHLADNRLESNIVLCLFQDSEGRVWAGSYFGGLSLYNPRTDSFEAVKLEADGRKITEINTIAEDGDGRLWLGTNGQGICIYNPANGSVEQLVHHSDAAPYEQIAGNSIHDILFDQNQNVWIGTSDAGLSMLNRRTGQFDQFNLINRRLNNNTVYSLVEDPNGNIWVGTSLGLVCISNGYSTFYNESAGVPELPIYSMVPDNDGNLWFSNTDGLSCFDLASKKVVRHTASANLNCREFKRGASYIDESGKMYFGGVGGLVSFYPKTESEFNGLLNVEFQDISIENSDNSSGLTSIPTHSKERIELDYDSNSFRVTFGAMEFNNPDDVDYFIMLEGYNDSWIPVEAGSQSALFSKIPPGNYVLKVRAQLGDSAVENSLPVTIKPPFYLTWWAKTIYVILFIGAILAIIIIVRVRNNRKIEHQRLRQEEKSIQEKLQFFTDISHEVRTPLTLILSPIASLKKKTSDKKLLDTYEMMESNGERILRMINQVIDLRKIESNSSHLQVSPTDIRLFLSRLCDAFSHTIEVHGIRFSLNFSDDVPQNVLIDRDKVDKVVFNVLANALRFTPDGGSVTINVDVAGSSDLRIRVSDTGPGVPKENWETIFERFFQTNSRHRSGGTGIGLHLSRKMMHLHHGSIFVENSSAEGTTFTITIPLSASIYAPNEVIEADNPVEERREVHLIPDKTTSRQKLTTTQKTHTLLIVEDDVNILEYLCGELSSEYNVITATDGSQGLEKAIRLRPHCIVTDISMDEMDGLEMCRKIRSNPQIFETPIVVITARASESQRLEGIEAGADAYITKPFNLGMLRAVISRLIHSRRAIVQKLTNAEMVNEDVAAMRSGEEKLLERIEAVVVSELANPDLNVEFIASEIGMSRSHLHRRLKELVNVSPSTYIKQARMRHAAILLTEKRMTVSEAAYATGFNSLSHFSTAFKDFYGVTPTNFVALNRQGDKFESIDDNS